MYSDINSRLNNVIYNIKFSVEYLGNVCKALAYYATLCVICLGSGVIGVLSDAL